MAVAGGVAEVLGETVTILADSAELATEIDVEAQSTMALVRQYYGDWEAGYVAPDVPVEP